MNLSDFLAQVDFFTPMIFRISVAAELALFASSKNRSNSIAIPRLPRSREALGFPKMLKLLWLKAPFAHASPVASINICKLVTNRRLFMGRAKGL